MQAAEDFCCVFVTTPSIAVARKLAMVALAEKLVACANLMPKVESHYVWQGQLQSSSEVLVLFKTSAERLPELEACVLRNHPYDTPEFVSFRLDQGNEKYLSWIAENTRKAA
jgi:periplasmic divalent cation tolerance protein